MKISVELSLYPLDDNYLEIIKETVTILNNEPLVDCITNTMSTQIFGEYENVMALVNKVISNSFEKYGKQVLVAKFLNSDLTPQNN